MKVGGRRYRSIFLHENGRDVCVIDQTLLPWRFEVRTLRATAEVADAIRTMVVRGAPLIGAAAAYGVALAMAEDASDASLEGALRTLAATRPTAVNLTWALERMRRALRHLPPAQRREAAYALAARICDEDVAINEAIGRHGLGLLREAAARRPPGAPLRILTHCNAGWLATVDVGTATAPVYRAHDEGLAVHVWVDETRPRLQGARLTAWELTSHGVPCTLVVDGAAPALLAAGEVDLVLVGTDRVAANGDVVNKIGTYPLALAAAAAGVPFYVAAPTPSIDASLPRGADAPIERRADEEILWISGVDRHGRERTVRVAPVGVGARNDAFDVTPAALVRGLITEVGAIAAAERAIRDALAHASRAPGNEVGEGHPKAPPPRA